MCPWSYLKSLGFGLKFTGLERKIQQTTVSCFLKKILFSNMKNRNCKNDTHNQWECCVLPGWFHHVSMNSKCSIKYKHAEFHHQGHSLSRCDVTNVFPEQFVLFTSGTWDQSLTKQGGLRLSFWRKLVYGVPHMVEAAMLVSQFANQSIPTRKLFSRSKSVSV